MIIEIEKFLGVVGEVFSNFFVLVVVSSGLGWGDVDSYVSMKSLLISRFEDIIYNCCSRGMV